MLPDKIAEASGPSAFPAGKAMQNSNKLWRHLTRRYQARTGHQRGQHERFFDARFHLVPLITESTRKTAAC
jgi:hypothetical protein